MFYWSVLLLTRILVLRSVVSWLSCSSRGGKDQLELQAMAPTTHCLFSGVVFPSTPSAKLPLATWYHPSKGTQHISDQWVACISLHIEHRWLDWLPTHTIAKWFTLKGPLEQQSIWPVAPGQSLFPFQFPFTSGLCTSQHPDLACELLATHTFTAASPGLSEVRGNQPPT